VQNENAQRDQRDNDKQIYTYNADWTIYALGFSWRETADFRLAIGSLKEDLSNEIQILKMSDDPNQDFTCAMKFDHSFPATKLLWLPSKSSSHPDLMATSSDYLRLWQVDEENNRVDHKSDLKDSSQQFSAPLTSFDWNQTDPNIIGV
jgi:WD repeat-containing protein 68